MTDPTPAPRYIAQQLGDDKFSWGPYDTQRRRWIISTRMLQSEAQERADQLNAAGVDWRYEDDAPRFLQPPTSQQRVKTALAMAERAADEAGRAYDAAIDNVQQVLEESGEDSDAFRQADEFAKLAHALHETTKDAAHQLSTAQPTT